MSVQSQEKNMRKLAELLSHDHFLRRYDLETMSYRDLLRVLTGEEGARHERAA